MKNTIVYYTIVKKEYIQNRVLKNNETVLARYVLKEMLKYFDIEFPDIYISVKGKPYFKDSDIFFNYSHSKNYIACAISFNEVGIDIEEVYRIISDGIAKKYLDGEKDNIKRIEKWVKKEAYSKLKGLGIQINFENINLNNILDDNILINTNEYLCSIYCGGNNITFKKIYISDVNCFK